ncbi:hypothetical protein LINPERHAP1_LOCUS1766, partial [Linum perenne]
MAAAIRGIRWSMNGDEDLCMAWMEISQLGSFDDCHILDDALYTTRGGSLNRKPA